MPFSLSPRVMNQNTSPGLTELSFPSTSDGTLPVPCPSCPWHDRQSRVYNSFPACAASSCPAYGFFATCAEAGALWNFVSTSVKSSAAGSRIIAAAKACAWASECMNPLLGKYNDRISTGYVIVKSSRQNNNTASVE